MSETEPEADAEDFHLTYIRKRQLQEELLTAFGVLIPGPLLSGLTVEELDGMQETFRLAAERFLSQQSIRPERTRPYHLPGRE